MPFSLIPFLLLVIPIAEIAVFVVVGGQIGVLATILLIIATAVTGSILLRIQGFGVMSRIRQTMDAGQLPGRDLVHGFMIMAAGLLLLTPGFITDSIGFLLFVPAFRDLAWSLVRDRVAAAEGTSFQWRTSRGGRTIDLDADEFERDGQRRPHDGQDRLR
ncbi:FxsA family protein [Mesorhizobium sp. Z1-4]|uniref:FxsA family protein n=1 Tax=Mesorhizobium sp. Z1-4 TaxID=2448478 RepID=UPI000FD9A589|nr:FxsA family protein [Mesorhizobium sp. Z1-4]